MKSGLANFLYFWLLLGVKTRVQRWRYRGVGRKSLSARIYRPGDERQIRALFHLTFRKHKSLTRWRWEFLENPFGKVNVVVLESERAGIVGHYGGIMVRCYVHGAIVSVSQLADVMIHSAFRGKGWSQLVHAYIQVSRGQGLKFL